MWNGNMEVHEQLSLSIALLSSFVHLTVKL